MKIKRFEASDMSAALRMIKKEFGEDAVILSAKTMKKSSGLLGSNLAYCLKGSYDILGIYYTHKVKVDGIRLKEADLIVPQNVVDLINDFEQKQKALQIIMNHYSSNKIHEFSKKMIEKIVIIKVNIESMTGKISSH